MEPFVHPELDENIEFFSGGYRFIEEGKLHFRGKEVLYLKGMAAVESSCCGTGGCGFIKVPGYVLSWKGGRDARGRPVSQVERISAGDQQKEIQEILRREHPAFSQIEFL